MTFMVTTIYSSIPVEWRGPDADVSYPDATAFMEARARDIAAGQAAECVWLLEHPSLYTAGTSAKDTDLLAPARFPVFNTGRGGQYTYHGPGQRVAYVMLDLRNRGRDVGAFVRTLEQWIIDTFAEFDVIAERRTGRVGVWVSHPGGREEKIAAIGIRLKKWISFHGISLNVNPDLSHFGGIIPCGISEHGVTSLSALYDKGLSQKATLRDVDVALKTNFQKLLGPTSA